MRMENKGDLIINGFGASNGGEFHHVTINGKGTINSDIDCTEFKCNGSGTVKGNVTATTAHISGTAKVIGNMESQDLKVDGTANIEQNLQAGALKVSGKVSIGGGVKSEKMAVMGLLKVGGDCETETFTAESRFKIGGLLTADQMDIKMYSNCQAKEIGGQTIMVKQKKSMLLGLFKSAPVLESELIEGDTIEIENTQAKVVRGNHVTVGPNCNIGVVEYKDEVTIDKKSIVGDIRKI